MVYKGAVIFLYRYCCIAVLLLAGCSGQTPAISAAKGHEQAMQGVEVLLVATYHFGNPGSDRHNFELDDYLSVKRQAEIEDVSARLSQFHADKILVECKPERQHKINEAFDRYRNGSQTISDFKNAANEIYQLGFRLARNASAGAPVCVDADGHWLGPYADLIAEQRQLDFYNQRQVQAGQEKAQLNEVFIHNTVGENLAFTNQLQQFADNHAYYNNIAIRVKDSPPLGFATQSQEMDVDGESYLMRSFDFENIGVELVAEWYKRNLFIYRNILENTAPGERVLVLFGQGHMHYLRQMLEDNPSFRVVDALSYLE